MTVADERFETLRTILSEMTGNDANDIHQESILTDDLGIVEETDLPRIVKRVNRDFQINLNSMAVVDEVETVQDLLTMITDEAELG
jgi:hypothetical protein